MAAVVPSLLRPTAPQPRRWGALLAAGPLALGVHGILVGLVVLSSKLTPPPPPKLVTQPMTIRRLDARQWAANRGARPPTARPEINPRGQVVDVAPGNDRIPQESKYLATTNNEVSRETKARDQTRVWSRATPKTQAAPETAPSAKGEAPKSTAPPPSGIDLTESMLGRRLPPPSLLPSTAPGTGDTEDRSTPAGTEAGTQASGSELTEGGGAPNDALDVPEGDGTYLNTREWRYAAFFNRVKQAVSARWDPNGRLKHRNRGLGAAVRVTVMHVALRPDGSLADLFVAQSSGMDELDAEAMTAFEKAAPFANPPPALVQHGLIRFTFSFNVSDEGLMAPSPFRFR